ncbi:MAG TPA: YihY/virulence factor BrkB family protein [Pirellulaceae bacterium]|nr:YihY/virulence factor BrkB family protein [Pirellulaceae bacterium]
MLALLKKTFDEFSRDECPRMAAAMAYYAVFSLPALLVIVISITGLIAGRDATVESLTNYFEDALGREGAAQVATMIEQASKPGRGIVASVIGVVVLLAGATGVMIELQTALNRAWGVAPDPQQSMWQSLVVKRLLSFGMLLGIVFLLLASLVISWLLTEFSNLIERWAPGRLSGEVLAVIHLAVSFAVITLLFAALLKYVPDAQVHWRDVWVGAAVTAALFVLGKFALGVYLSYSNVTSTYGAAGSLILILLWVYYSALILFFGAEFTQVWADRKGHVAPPEPGAVEMPRVGEARPA